MTDEDYLLVLIIQVVPEVNVLKLTEQRGKINK